MFPYADADIKDRTWFSVSSTVKEFFDLSFEISNAIKRSFPQTDSFFDPLPYLFDWIVFRRIWRKKKHHDILEFAYESLQFAAFVITNIQDKDYFFIFAIKSKLMEECYK